ncbi:MAG: hypothetical protein LBQ73_07435, partial [Tannerellaceae bacterium]|nr:hypothetical protein [Tannerellaceae bacterium]
MDRRTFVRNTGLLGLAASFPVSGSPVAARTNHGQADQPETYHLVREIPVGDTYDMIIAGGGPAGAS